MPSMVNSIETVPTEVPQILPTEVSTNHPGEGNTPIWPKGSCWVIKIRYQEKTIETTKNNTQNKAALRLLQECYWKCLEETQKRLERKPKRSCEICLWLFRWYAGWRWLYYIIGKWRRLQAMSIEANLEG